jgi:alanine-glyoxylate transaminase/serine-glyoxylate transaminase/serine-pyruvate transaminase
MSLGNGLSRLAGKVFRIGHLGWLNEAMVLQALGGAELAMRHCGINFQAGAGVGAAVEHFTESTVALPLAAE